MNDQLALLDLLKAHLRALEFLLKRVPPLENIWVLTGSAGLRLQGVDVPVHDLDIQADEKTWHFDPGSRGYPTQAEVFLSLAKG
jgi:hypothetical protein